MRQPRYHATLEEHRSRRPARNRALFPQIDEPSPEFGGRSTEIRRRLTGLNSNFPVGDPHCGRAILRETWEGNLLKRYVELPAEVCGQDDVAMALWTVTTNDVLKNADVEGCISETSCCFKGGDGDERQVYVSPRPTPSSSLFRITRFSSNVSVRIFDLFSRANLVRSFSGTAGRSYLTFFFLGTHFLLSRLQQSWYPPCTK